ncbi:Rieske (2Fe-2S) protein [Salinisphaera aquimarina]|uniref:Rieske (2Fe-2S) protein n=1 Tax=Salinisphaera aquimarina TaxID=2094031 RepID=A0ABV7ENM2_9GAMM
MAATEHRVAHISDIPDDEALITEVKGRPIGIFKVDGELFAVRNLCPHRGAPLARGTVGGTMLPTCKAGELNYGMENQVLKCPWHGWEFDLKTGQCLFGVSDRRVATYNVRVEDDNVYVEV